METKRLYRSVTERKIAGVAGGLAEYFSMDPLLVRLIFILLAFAYGTSVLIYLVLWIVTPEKPFDFSAVVNQPVADPPKPAQPVNPVEPQKSSDPFPPKKTKKKGGLIGGLVLICLGVLFLIDEFIPNIDFGDLWPVILIVIGAGILINAFTGRNKNNV
jgi:phage shock protein PspC (stress-responsive transcriptional regulator)